LSKIAVIGDGETTLGFGLAGVRLCVSCDETNANEKVRELLANDEVGLVIMSQDALKWLSHKVRKQVDASVKPVVITIPGRTARESAGSAQLGRMIKRAIGVDLTKG